MVINQYEFFDLMHSLLPTKLPRKDFYREVSDLYRKSYSLKRLFKRKTTPLNAKRLIGVCFYYLKVLSYLRKIRNAYKMERKISGKSFSHQSVLLQEKDRQKPIGNEISSSDSYSSLHTPK